MPPSTIVLITGANSGIGLATAKYLVEHSDAYHVIVGARVLEKGRQAVAELQSEALKGTLSTVEIDVTDEDSISAAALTVGHEFGRIDVLVNNAGVSNKSPNLKENLSIHMMTNSIGPALVKEGFKELLSKSNNARLIYITSGIGSLSKASDPNDRMSALTVYGYQMSKAALNMLAVLDNRTYGPRGWKVWTFCPGFVQSNLRGKSQEVLDAAKEQGAEPASSSAAAIARVIEGGRDSEVGQFIHASGTYPW